MADRICKRKTVAMLTSISLCGALVAESVSAETFPRLSAAEGTVIAHKAGEEAQFIEMPSWRAVDVDQNLLAGDVLRTNAGGNLTIRFSDKTLVRMGRNTTLLVKKISETSDSVLDLKSGSVWARAIRGGAKLTIDTPAAAAAIRGTDWTLRVDSDQTTLTVLEGAVELANGQGKVLVNQGEGASVNIGKAPRKYTLVNLREREQMLLYGELRGVFSGLSLSGSAGPATRAARKRILALPLESRRQDDWLTLAETSLEVAGRAEARAALSQLKRPLKWADEARAKLVEAMLAGQETRYDEAAALFAQALPDLPRNRKATAAYGLWFARSLAQPDRAVAPLKQGRYAGDPAAILAQADAIAHISGQADAIKLLEQAEKRFPNDARLPAARGSLALQLDRRDEVKQALARAEAIDPDNPSMLLTRARFKTVISSDLDGALADLNRAAEVAPGADDVWNEIGIIQSDRNAIVESDTAYRRAIELNPENPAIYADYARFLMDNDQVAEAKRAIDKAEAIDARSYAVLAAKGRYLLRIGKAAEGEKALLDASALDPTYGDALIGLAIASYQQNASEETMQALDNADRFDAQNPSIPLIKSGIALDQFQADEAIRQAREALRRRQERGGYYSGYDANRQASSFLGATLGNLGLDEWSHYYSDRASDPFKSTTYLDESIEGRTTPFIGVPPVGFDRFPIGGSYEASVMQGLVLDPLGVASEGGRNSLERRRFFEAVLGGNMLDQGQGIGWGSDIRLQGTSYASIPLSYNIQASVSRPKELRQNDAEDLQGGFFQLGIRPTLQDSAFLFGHSFDQDRGYPGQTFNPAPFNEVKSNDDVVGGAWSHTIGERNIIQAFAVASDSRRDEQFRTREAIGGSDIFYRVNQHSTDKYFAFGFNHLLGIGPVTLRYGAEALDMESTISQTSVRLFDDFFEDFGSFSETYNSTRTYIDATLDVSNDLQFQTGAYRVRFDGEEGRWGPLDFRLGAAWSPVDGHWLRAYYRQDTQFPTNYTLSPISTVGLSPLDLPVSWGGQTETSALRWDAEWNDRLFTSVEYQHQRFNGLFLAPEDMLTSFLTSEGEINRVNVGANYWIGGGLGAFGSLTFNASNDLTAGWNDDFSVPLVPDYVAQVGLKYVHSSGVTAAVAQNFVGKRVGSQYYDFDTPVAPVLDRYTTTDAIVTWTSENKRVDWSLAVTNILDHKAELADAVPAPGRTFRMEFKSRF